MVSESSVAAKGASGVHKKRRKMRWDRRQARRRETAAVPKAKIGKLHRLALAFQGGENALVPKVCCLLAICIRILYLFPGTRV